MKLSSSSLSFVLVALMPLFLVATLWPSEVWAQTLPTIPLVSNSARVETTDVGLSVRLAPGELLPVSVKLINFGSVKRVDVLVTYEIVNMAGTQIYVSSETVAVETTNNFIKTLQIPWNTPAAKYTAKTSIIYSGQLVPSTTHFSFMVEPKILGVFRHDFYLYGGIALVASVLLVLLGYSLVSHRHRMRSSPIDYPEIPRGQRVFYELVSDAIAGMRRQVGEKALVIASQIDGLIIDRQTGKVLKLAGTPSKIIADLVASYEQTFGKKVSFSFRNGDNDKAS